MYPGPGPIHEPRRAGAVWALILASLVISTSLGAGIWLHNGLIARREAVAAAWAQVESNYQRRADLIPVLVQVVERHMRHESQTLERVVSGRSASLERFSAAARQLADAQQSSARALEALAGAAPATQEELGEIAAAQTQVDRGLHQVIALAESYPALRSADQFLELQAQLEGTENRINVARMGFNEAVREYNAALEKLPTNYIARAKGYERRAYFETSEKARRAAPLGFH
jgi:LemA protein